MEFTKLHFFCFKARAYSLFMRTSHIYRKYFDSQITLLTTLIDKGFVSLEFLHKYIEIQ